MANLLSDDLVVVGNETRKQLTKLKVDAQHHYHVFLGIQNVCTTVVSYLLDNYPLSNGFLQDLGCLNPLCRDDPTSIVTIRRVVEKLKGALPSTLNNLEEEWRVYQLDSGELPKRIEENATAVVEQQSLK